MVEELEQRPREAGRAADPAAVLRAQLGLLHQPDLGGVLTVLAGADPGGLSCAIGCLLWDAALDAWYLTALLDRRGKPVDVAALGLTSGPLAFRIPQSAAPRPLDELLGPAWDPAASAQLEALLGTASALCVPIPGMAAPRGALLALLPPTTDAVALAGVLAHGATAAARHLSEGRETAANCVLPPSALRARAVHELKRAERYGWPLTVVVLVADRVAQLPPLAARLTRAVRGWDFVGRWESAQPTLVAVLPETGRAGGQGLIRRLQRDLAELAAGVAAFPDDGAGFQQLVEQARGRLVSVAAASAQWRPGQAADAIVWTRGALAGPDRTTIRCPVCLAPYTAGTTAEPDVPGEGTRALALDQLRRLCPSHLGQFATDRR